MKFTNLNKHNRNHINNETNKQEQSKSVMVDDIVNFKASSEEPNVKFIGFPSVK